MTFWVMLCSIGIVYLLNEVSVLKNQIKALNGENRKVIDQLKTSIGEWLVIDCDELIIHNVAYTKEGYVNSKILSVDAEWCEMEVQINKKGISPVLVRCEMIQNIVGKMTDS